ncbi:recombinase family protein [Flindersiella endophytica]
MASKDATRRVALYARLSVTTEESVSIERQLDACRKYADARGWTVAVEAVDDGVSATKNKPEDRAGWRALLDSGERFEAVIVWKVDRLARRVLDFLHADEALRDRGAGLVAVEDPIDMTTAQGRAFATMLAVFAELEAAAISARVKAARRAILAAGRRAGGRPPFGFINVPNPDGPGMVLAHDPERIDDTRELVRRAFTRESVYGLARWFEESGVQPRERSGRKSDTHWHEASIEAILRAPALAGMTTYTPSRKPGEKVLTDVLRGADGLPVIDESIAIITPAERRDLLAILDEAKRPGTRQKAGAEPALLYGLARCATCGRLLYRHTSGGYLQYRCPGVQKRNECASPAGINRGALEKHVVAEFLRAVGGFEVVELEPVEGDDPAPGLTEIEHAISETTARMADDDADVPALAERLAALKDARSKARAVETSAPAVRAHRTGETFAAAWERTEDVEEHRGLLMTGLEAVEVAPSRTRNGREPIEERVNVVWREGGVEDYDTP